jgi:pimeloyl-ACP methyl ester carboxylesterase
VGHDFGANVAWHAALMRPDRFVAVFGMSVPYRPRGERSYIQLFREAGREDFYMFRMMAPGAAEAWADAAVTYPSLLYWSSGSPPEEDRWDPFDADRTMYRRAPIDIPSWADPSDVAYAVAEFSRTGFQGGLNYYHSIQPGFDLTAAYRGAKITQPSFFLTGALDGVRRIRATTEEELRAWLPDLRGFVELSGVGHWPQWEAPEAVNAALLSFLKGLN